MENASKALIIAGAILISILLITIGIVLINSGRDVVDTGTAGMTSQKIQTFNSQFTAYEGTKKGSELKGLANVVRSSNATDSEHQVALYLYDIEDSSGNPIDSLAKLTNTKNYNVTLSYAEANTTAHGGSGNVVVNPTNFSTENGYVMLITISE